MPNTPVKPTQRRGEETRQKLLGAAIDCLAKYGYAGAELGLISDTAEVARRSRQYYFPSRVDLMLAVWHEIRRRDELVFDTLKELETLREKVDMILETGFKKYKTPQYLADLELKLALRSDRELEKELAPLMEAKEVETDKMWIDLFKGLGKPDSEIIEVRHLHVGLLRGIIFEYLTRVDQSLLPQLEERIRAQIHNYLV